MKEVIGIFTFFITIGLSSGAMSMIVAGVVSLLGLGTILSMWFKQDNL